MSTHAGREENKAQLTNNGNGQKIRIAQLTKDKADYAEEAHQEGTRDTREKIIKGAVLNLKGGDNDKNDEGIL